MITIEESILKNLLFNDEYSRKVYPYLKDEYFENEYRTLFSIYRDQFDEYGTPPTVESLAIGLQKTPMSDDDFENVYNLVETCIKHKNDSVNVDWLVKETEQFCQDVATSQAVYKAISILDGHDKKLDKNAIPELMEKALSISFDDNIGMEFAEDAEKRHDIYTAPDTRIELPLDALMTLSNGGLKKKTLSCILAGINVGKSALMAFISGELLKKGYDVLYISLEMAEEEVHQRIEANLLNITTDDLAKMSKEDYLKGINKIKSKTNGRFFVKQYPTASAHAGHFRHLLKELQQKKKFKPDVIMLDYINICASSRYRTMNGVNSYSYVKAIAEEVRGLAVEFDVPILTATQVTRGEFNNSSPDMTATSESFGLPASLDWFIAATQDETLAEQGKQLLSLLKTRWGNKAKARPRIVNVNFDKMRYTDVDSIDSVKDSVGQNKPEKPKSKMRPENERTVNEIEWD